ncbi:MAG: hypothetical protein K0S04_3237 [Herbinix sp.]|jgi:hypothetical protein|nr:hypothetical protein [Herbinix sp.]
MSNKMKVFRIIFWLSFAPLLFLICYSAYHAIFGYDVYTLILPQYVKTIFGWDAFYRVFVWTAIALTFIPILPICLLYQVIYGIVFLVKKIKSLSVGW